MSLQRGFSALTLLAGLFADRAAGVATGSAGWTLQMLHDAAAQDGAVCLDGTSPGYYIRRGVGADAANFKIHFKGGGWCMTDQACVERSKGWLGSSKQWGPVPAGTTGDTTKNPSEGAQGLLNNNASNPFGNWTAIFVEYCDGSSYTSDRADPVVIGKDKIYYRGWRVLNALINDWLKQG